MATSINIGSTALGPDLQFGTTNNAREFFTGESFSGTIAGFGAGWTPDFSTSAAFVSLGPIEMPLTLSATIGSYQMNLFSEIGQTLDSAQQSSVQWIENAYWQLFY